MHVSLLPVVLYICSHLIPHQVSFSECGHVVDAEYIKTNNPSVDISPGGNLLPQAGYEELKEQLLIGKLCFTECTSLFNIAIAALNMLKGSLVVVLAGSPGVGKTKLLV